MSAFEGGVNNRVNPRRLAFANHVGEPIHRQSSDGWAARAFTEIAPQPIACFSQS